MRLKAKTELKYAGKVWEAGALFDALEKDGLDLINKGQAEPFNLENPSQRLWGDIARNLAPPAPPLPDVPPVTISPTSNTVVASGGTGSFTVTITGEGQSGTWTVDKDAVATWLTVVSPTTPQSTNGAVNYNVAVNAGTERIAHCYINGKTFTLTQSGI